ncbi:MAG: imidazole glycerol phosphate synthase subunit HisH, partial [Myxococcales bacterium]|nr:imidazole glycerol phosphate synthase subunit HisH [Myxococcales bacterium]
EEFGPVQGLDWLSGRVVRLQRTAERKVPNMGWCPVQTLRPHPVLAASGEKPYFYFVHSYYAQCEDLDDTLAIICPEGDEEPITAAVAKNALIAVQFHPEKSSASGLKLLEAFCRWTP